MHIFFRFIKYTSDIQRSVCMLCVSWPTVGSLLLISVLQPSRQSLCGAPRGQSADLPRDGGAADSPGLLPASHAP